MDKIMAVLLLTLPSWICLALQNEVIVTDGDWKENPSRDPRQPNVTLRDKMISLNTGVITYGIRAVSAFTEGKKTVVPVEGYLGMPQPKHENWYGGGFMAIALNGNNVGGAPLKAMRVVESGERGALDVIWDAPEAAVRVRFLALPARDELFCEIGLEPKQELKTVSIRLAAYPSFFTSWHKQKGHRVVESLASKAEEGDKLIADPQKDWALIYYDTVFDFAAGRGVGPCAMLYLPEQIKECKVNVGDYCVPTELMAQPGVQNIRMIFWDFNGKSNKDAIAYFKSKAASCQEELRRISFINRTLVSFDFDKKKAETDRMIASAKGTEPFAKKLAEVDARLAPICQQVREVIAKGQAIPFGLEEEALKLIAERQEVEWKLKFHVLLED